MNDVVFRCQACNHEIKETILFVRVAKRIYLNMEVNIKNKYFNK